MTLYKHIFYLVTLASIESLFNLTCPTLFYLVETADLHQMHKSLVIWTFLSTVRLAASDPEAGVKSGERESATFRDI